MSSATGRDRPQAPSDGFRIPYDGGPHRAAPGDQGSAGQGDWPDVGGRGPGGRDPRGRAPGGLGDGRPRGPRGGLRGHDGRRLVPAGRVLAALLIGLVLAALLNADSLREQAEAMHVGTARSIVTTLVKPITAVSSLLRLDEPRAAVERALGRGDKTQANVHTRTSTPRPTPDASGTKTPDPSSSAAVFTPTPDHKLALWVGGDSMAMTFGESLVAMADGTGVIESALDYHVSSGLSRPDFFNWPKRIRAEMKSFRPDVAVAVFGANDGQDVDYQGQVLQYGTKPWLDLYHERVGEAMDLLGGSQKRQVWWVGMPTARNAEQSAIYKTLDSVYAAEAKERPNVHYVDTYALFSKPGGGYSDYLKGISGKTELMRQEDGIHWTRAGGDLAAATVLREIAKAYDFEFSP